MDESTIPAGLAAVEAEVAELVAWLSGAPDLDLATAETATLGRMRALGGRLREAGLAARAAGHGPCRCACGATAWSEG